MAEQLWSFTIHCAEAMTDKELVRDTVVRVIAPDVERAEVEAKRVLGKHAERKTVYWPGEIVEIRDTG